MLTRLPDDKIHQLIIYKVVDLDVDVILVKQRDIH